MKNTRFLAFMLMALTMSISFTACSDDDDDDDEVNPEDVEVSIGELKDSGSQLVWSVEQDLGGGFKVTTTYYADYEGDNVTALKEVWTLSSTEFAQAMEDELNNNAAYSSVKRDGKKVTAVYKEGEFLYDNVSTIKLAFGKGGFANGGNGGTTGGGSSYGDVPSDLQDVLDAVNGGGSSQGEVTSVSDYGNKLVYSVTGTSNYTITATYEGNEVTSWVEVHNYSSKVIADAWEESLKENEQIESYSRDGNVITIVYNEYYYSTYTVDALRELWGLPSSSSSGSAEE